MRIHALMPDSNKSSYKTMKCGGFEVVRGTIKGMTLESVTPQAMGMGQTLKSTNRRFLFEGFGTPWLVLKCDQPEYSNMQNRMYVWIHMYNTHKLMYTYSKHNHKYTCLYIYIYTYIHIHRYVFFSHIIYCNIYKLLYHAMNQIVYLHFLI